LEKYLQEQLAGRLPYRTSGSEGECRNVAMVTCSYPTLRVGYERVLSDDEVDRFISKVLTQRLERTNGFLRQQTGPWHRRQNKFSKVWGQTKVVLRSIVTYFNWIWLHSCLRTTATQQTDLTSEP
jgi:hypothetical protein